MTRLTVRRAGDAERPVIAQLLELYLYDMSEIHPFAIGSDGLYRYERLDEFWQHPYLLFLGDDMVGLALVIERCPITGCEPCYFMAEFFVLGGYRGRGLGVAAAEQIFKAHPGLWHVGVMTANGPAMAFWRKVVAPFGATASKLTHDGEPWILYELEA